jgi:uncharacterized protein YggL (DUF469 family)
MNKRLRKKLRKGEFQELGLRLDVTLPHTLDENGLDAWWEEFMKQWKT